MEDNMIRDVIALCRTLVEETQGDGYRPINLVLPIGPAARSILYEELKKKHPDRDEFPLLWGGYGAILQPPKED